MSGKIDFSNLAKLSGSSGIFAGAKFLPDLEPKSGTALVPSPIQGFIPLEYLQYPAGFN